MVSSSLEGELKVIDSLKPGVNRDVRRQLHEIYESRIVDRKLNINIARCQVSSLSNSRLRVAYCFEIVTI